VSVLLKRGSHWRVEAVSGLDAVDTRARSVRLLSNLTKLVAATGEALWHYGSDRDLPPQLENSVHELVDETHASALAIVPLRRPVAEETSDNRRQKSPLIAAIVVEQLQGETLAVGFKQRVSAVADHGAAALANALDHDAIFMLPVLQALGKLQSVVAMRNLPKTMIALGVVAAMIAALVVTPARFELEGRGTLEPVVRREVFASVDGIVDNVPVAHNQHVSAGQTLVELKSTSDLEVAVADLVGKKLATRERMAAIERALLGEQRLAVEEQDRLSGQLFQLRKTAQSIDAQLELYEQKRAQLVVVSPIDGQVVTWHVQDRLLHRPVRKGQTLLTVVDANDAWELEIHMPERRMGHIGRATQNFDEPLPVKFTLATHPGEEFAGTVQEVDRIADQGEEGPTVLVRVAIEKAQLPDLRPGASVTARIDCGARPLGYVWFHDVWEFVQTQILFRL
jgi:multidrug efflux pump subunit AcrA (membrane-fusion protein)